MLDKTRTVILSLMIPIGILLLCGGSVFLFVEYIGNPDPDLPTLEPPIGDPKEAARAFMEALYTGDLTGCTEYASEEIRLSIQEQCLLYQRYNTSVDMSNVTYTEELQIATDYIVVRMSGVWTYEGIDSETQEAFTETIDTPVLLSMVFEDGAWRVDNLVDDFTVTTSADEALKDFLYALYAGDTITCLSYINPLYTTEQNRQTLEGLCGRFVGKNGVIDLKDATLLPESNSRLDFTVSFSIQGRWAIAYDDQDGNRISEIFDSSEDPIPVFVMKYADDRWYIIGTGRKDPPTNP